MSNSKLENAIIEALSVDDKDKAIHSIQAYLEAEGAVVTNNLTDLEQWSQDISAALQAGVEILKARVWAQVNLFRSQLTIL